MLRGEEKSRGDWVIIVPLEILQHGFPMLLQGEVFLGSSVVYHMRVIPVTTIMNLLAMVASSPPTDYMASSKHMRNARVRLPIVEGELGHLETSRQAEGL